MAERSAFCAAEVEAAAMGTQYKKRRRGCVRGVADHRSFYRRAACCKSTSAKRRGASSAISTAGHMDMPVEMAAMYAVPLTDGAGLTGAVAITGGSVNVCGAPNRFAASSAT